VKFPWLLSPSSFLFSYNFFEFRDGMVNGKQKSDKRGITFPAFFLASPKLMDGFAQKNVRHKLVMKGGFY
jgi:hypothetical protein